MQQRSTWQIDGYRRRKAGLWDYRNVRWGRYIRTAAGRRRHWRCWPW